MSQIEQQWGDIPRCKVWAWQGSPEWGREPAVLGWPVPVAGLWEGLRDPRGLEAAHEQRARPLRQDHGPGQGPDADCHPAGGPAQEREGEGLIFRLLICLLKVKCLRWGWLPWWSISIPNSQRTQSSKVRSQSGSALNLRLPRHCLWATCPRWRCPSSWRTHPRPLARATPTLWLTWCRWPRPRPLGPWQPCPSAAGLSCPEPTPLPPSRLCGPTLSMTRAHPSLRWDQEPVASLETAIGGGWPITTGATPTLTLRRTSPRTGSSTGSRTWGRHTLTQL